MFLFRLVELSSFEYDIQTLAKSFLPKEDLNFVKMTIDEYKLENSNNSINNQDIYVDLLLTSSENATDEVSLFINILKAEKLVYKDDLTIDIDNKKELKNVLKRMVYNGLHSLTGVDLPWGTLTGIRPTKIATNMMNENYSDNEIIAYMKNNYYTSQEKIDLCIEIAKKEAKLLEGIDYENGYSVYIGIPFCPSTCSYCSFTSYPIGLYTKKVDAYLEALGKEIDFAANAYRHKKLNSIYVGGGTPTTLTPEQLDKLLERIYSSFDMQYVKEITVEAGRPDSITKEKLDVLAKYKIDRISINPQTMKESTLKLIGRRHTVKQVIDAYELAKNYSFSINMDFIIGLPEETKQDIVDTFNKVIELKPDMVTVHSLAIKRAARLTTNNNEYKKYDSVNNSEIMNMTNEFMKKIELTPYYLYRQKNMSGNMENVGYSRLDKGGIYNILIMEDRQTILALGAGGVSKFIYPDKVTIKRVDDVKDVDQYIERIDEMIDRKREQIEKMEQEA